MQRRGVPVQLRSAVRCSGAGGRGHRVHMCSAGSIDRRSVALVTWVLGGTCTTTTTYSILKYLVLLLESEHAARYSCQYSEGDQCIFV